MSIRIPLTMSVFCASVAMSHAQTSFPDTEPNESKAAATVIGCLAAGDSITGTSIGALTTAGAASVDYFRVRTCALPPGIYEHRLTHATANGGSIRGVGQTGVPGSGGSPNALETELQSNQTTPTRFNMWYGFGRQEELYYRVTGSASTTAQYTSTLSTTPITATPLGTFAAGTITITTIGQGHVNDTDLWVYDASLAAIPAYGNDEDFNSVTFLSTLTRVYAVGDYYLALTRYDLANEYGAAADDSWVHGNCTDFPGFAVHGVVVSQPNDDVSFAISDTFTTLPVAAAVNTASNKDQILWFSFSVRPAAVFHAFCAGDGSFTDHTTPCPCGNHGAPGHGCGHSFDPNGAQLSATGAAASDDVVLHAQFEPSTSFTSMMQHANAGESLFHDGVLCAANPLIRLRGRAAVAGEAFFPNSNFAQDSTTTLSIRGGVGVGSGATRYYAAWYRNASSTFCPPATANVTNGWVIVW